MRIAILTNEYPPHIYGGAGVHVEYLTREIARLDGGAHQVEVLCFGDQKFSKDNLRVRGVAPEALVQSGDPRHSKVLVPFQQNLQMAGMLEKTDIVHCHTWYTHLAGCLIKQLHNVPLVLSTHSLEPHRPWKREQLGSGYDATTWMERTAYRNADGIVAVSASMERDVVTLYGVNPDRVQVIYNGIDVQEYAPVHAPEVVARYGIDPDDPYVLFVGRITRQKGIVHFLRAARYLENGTQILLCASSPDTEEIGRETQRLVEEVRASGIRISWIRDMVPRKDIVPLYSHAAVFVCPSIYEPFGIINLEAMACGTPVVGSKVGGIAEAVLHRRTGLLVPYEPAGHGDPGPRDPKKFASDLGAGINLLLQNTELREEMGRNARARVVESFGWDVIAGQTLEFYAQLISTRERRQAGRSTRKGQ
ncbi:MAG: glycogen synthase [Desulfovibrionales bacterium]